MIDNKKNPKAVIENYSKIFFQIGLVLTLVIINFMMEHKTYDVDNSNGLGVVNMTEEIKEDIPIIIQQVLPPLPPTAPVIMEQIKVVEDDIKIEESIIESTETDEKTAVFKSNTEIVEVREKEEIVEDIPFVLIEDVPVFPGCEKVEKSKRLECFMEQMAKHIKRNQNYPERAMEDNIQGRVAVLFVIDKDGSITNVQVRGPKGGELLEKEAKRVIEKLPKFKPGMQRGKPVKVKYSQPITFKLQ